MNIDNLQLNDPSITDDCKQQFQQLVGRPWPCAGEYEPFAAIWAMAFLLGQEGQQWDVQPEAVQVPQAVRTAPERIWLQADINELRADDPFENDGVTWCAESVGGTEVEYVRADLAATHPPAQESGPLQQEIDYAIEHGWPAASIDRLTRIRAADRTRAPAAPQAGEAEKLAALAKRNIFDAIRDAYDLGYNDARNAKAAPGDSAPGYKGRDVEEDHGGALFNTLQRRWLASQPMSREGGQPHLKVVLTSFPESNGKTNWTALLTRVDPWDGLVGSCGGITIARGELWNRVAYEAERARFLLGERDSEPFILDYGDDIRTPDEWKGEKYVPKRKRAHGIGGEGEA